MLYEQLELPVDANVIAQYLQHSEIAERFASYYELFNKYRSDYRVEAIYEGAAPAEIVARARTASFDERLALLSLLLDGLSSRMNAIRETAQALEPVRAALREAKPRLQNGASVDEALSPHIKSPEERVSALSESQTSSRESLKCAITALANLKELASNATHAKVEDRYAALVASFQEEADSVSRALDNSFTFISETFGEDREMLVFVTELTARHDTSQFIARFGSESYHEHSAALSTEANRDAIHDEIDALLDGE